MTISVQLYTIRDAIAADADAALARLAGLGFESVELFAFADLEDRYAGALAASGLGAPSGHNSLATVDDLDRVFDAAIRLGVGTVIEPAVRDGWDDADAVRALARRLNQVSAAAAGRGLRVGYHNHWWEFAPLEGVAALELLAAHLDPDVVLELDVYWAAVAGMDAPALLGRLGERVRFLHVKDGVLAEGIEAQAPAGSGEIDWDAVFTAAPGAQRVIEFDAYAGDLFEGIAGSLAFLRGRGDTE